MKREESLQINGLNKGGITLCDMCQSAEVNVTYSDNG